MPLELGAWSTVQALDTAPTLDTVRPTPRPAPPARRYDLIPPLHKISVF